MIALTDRPDLSTPLPDILTGGLSIVFCGINPGLCAAAAGHHFLGRGNRFWRTAYLAGFTPREMRPEEDREILHHGCGLTTLVARPTARADQLAVADFRTAAGAFEQKMKAHAPLFIAFLGKAAWSALSGVRDMHWGAQPARFGGARVWVLPNPSGRNRAFSLEQLVGAYRALRQTARPGQLPAQAS